MKDSILRLSDANDIVRERLRQMYAAKESEMVRMLLGSLDADGEMRANIFDTAHSILQRIRSNKRLNLIEAFMKEYDLSSNEGVVLMCIAEALLRIPDSKTAAELIQDKIVQGRWDEHVGRSSSWLVNAATWSLLVGGNFLFSKNDIENSANNIIYNMVSRLSAPVFRVMIGKAMQILGKHFILGHTIKEALRNSNAQRKLGYTHSYDVSGESARTTDDARKYYGAYAKAIEIIGESLSTEDSIYSSPSISVKLSALHPRYEELNFDRVSDELYPLIRQLCIMAKDRGMALFIDAEESGRLDVSLDIIKALAHDEELMHWDGLGFAIQAYQKRCFCLIDWLAGVASRTSRRIMVRLVKGSYWGYEIKNAQDGGHSDYPVFTRKVYTDLSYIACAKKLIARNDVFYPCFATHNIHTVSAILELTKGKNIHFEFQRWQGMGEDFYDPMMEDKHFNVSCRVYAPVGVYADLLPYLVRRMPKNGISSAFANHMRDDDRDIKDLIGDPIVEASRLAGVSNSDIALPLDIFGSDRRNSRGLNLDNLSDLRQLYYQFVNYQDASCVSAAPIINGVVRGGKYQDVFSPAALDKKIGSVTMASEQDAKDALEIAAAAYEPWNKTSVAERADALDRAANLLEDDAIRFMYLLNIEAGKTIKDAISEVRKAVDLLRYYAQTARKNLGGPNILPGSLGERNELTYMGKGVFLCISPWNFPLAIFIGQIAAALVTGNTVLAKPSEQTSIVGYEMVKLMYDAGVPGAVLHYLPGSGSQLGGVLLPDPRLIGVAFTGSTETAMLINRILAARDGPLATLIAETGGINAMIVDSSALPEQVTDAVIRSAFQSAGQRCSALRVLCIQSDVFEKMVEMISGAMQELSVGNPLNFEIDVGPVIDEKAKTMLSAYIKDMDEKYDILARTPVSADMTKYGHFIAPVMYNVPLEDFVDREVFGPVLHVVRYDKSELEQVIKKINSTGYGLTFGVHSRITDAANRICAQIDAGNVYVNRDQLGSVVGMQPFGGRGLSGTGPKTGGPLYLYRFVMEKVCSTNIAAAGLAGK